MEKIRERVAALRQEMIKAGIDAYIVSGTDPHGSEYLPARWQQREWISGFTGSFGTVVVTASQAGLWTDTRYFLQANRELAGSGIDMYKLRVPEAVDYPEWLAATLPSGSTVGFDPYCFSVTDARRLERTLGQAGIHLQSEPELLDRIWIDRPAAPTAAIVRLEERYAGLSAEAKLAALRERMAVAGEDYRLLGAPDEIAWLLNVRGDDIPYNPVSLAYVVVGSDSARLFIDERKVNDVVRHSLAGERIETLPYEDTELFFGSIDPCRIGIDPDTLNRALYDRIRLRHEVSEAASPVSMMKAVKNEVEIAGFREAHRRDGLAMVRFLAWLDREVPRRRVTEIEAAEKLSALRAADPDARGDSFETISATGPNAASPHYSATPENYSVIRPDALYLVDSGGQYLFGTTDITRTVSFAPQPEEVRKDFTLVLRGMIALARAVFPLGTCGAQIDAVAREPLWQARRNFGHGTGHGVGHYLCVHEGPQDIRQNLRNVPLLPGMVNSDEPGIYREGCYGIRHENLLLTVALEENEFGKWCGFETLTLCPFDTSMILPEWLGEEARAWLNDYHERVRRELAPALEGEALEWLERQTKAI